MKINSTNKTRLTWLNWGIYVWTTHFLYSLDWDCALHLNVNIFRQVSNTLNSPDCTDWVITDSSEECSNRSLRSWLRSELIRDKSCLYDFHAFVVLMSCVWQGIVGNLLVYHHRQQTRFLQSVGPWYLFLSVSQSRWTIANKILLSVHLSELGSFTDREDVFEDWLCREILLINKHACFVNEWTNQRHQYKTGLYVLQITMSHLPLTDSVQPHQYPHRKHGHVTEANTWI